MRVLGHTTTLIRIKEHVVNVEGCSYEGLVVSNRGGDGASGGSLASLRHNTRAVVNHIGVAAEGRNGPQALVNGADIKVNLHFVVLYEPLIPPLSRYLSAVSLRLTYYINETNAGD